MRTKSHVVLAVLAVACAGFEASESGEAFPSMELGGEPQPIIGGTSANSPKLNAIGTLGFIESYVDWETGERVESFFPFCTASLIAPKTVLTAKHCARDIEREGSESREPAFGIGPDASNPQRKVRIVAVENDPMNEGGIARVGHDVSAVHLGEAVTDLTPLKYAQLTAADIGKRFGAIGYGVHDVHWSSGPRLAGNVTLNALEGRWFELMFGNYESFREWVRDMSCDDVFAEDATDGGVGEGDGDKDAGGDGDSDPDACWRELYENTKLIPGYEAEVGRRKGDVQPCRGDSGGPLVKANSKGELVSYGVNSAALTGKSMPCDKGSIYAAFGPDVLSFIDQAKAWVDPCEGLTTAGMCHGDTMLRCTKFDEGERRSIETDCSLLGQTCALTPSGEAVCVGEGEEPVGTDGQSLSSLPSEEEMRDFNSSVEVHIDSLSIGPPERLHK